MAYGIYNTENFKKTWWVTTFALLLGIILSGTILGLLVHFYQKAYDNENEEDRLHEIRNVDIAGLVVIVVVGFLYWLILSKFEFFGVCLGEEITEVWPHLAFRYGLGLGVFLPLLKLVPKRISNTTDNYYNNLEEYFPLLIISLIMGSYTFMFLQWVTMTKGWCPSHLLPMKKGVI